VICGTVLVTPLAVSSPRSATPAGNNLVLAAGSADGAGSGALDGDVTTPESAPEVVDLPAPSRPVATVRRPMVRTASVAAHAKARTASSAPARPVPTVPPAANTGGPVGRIVASAATAPTSPPSSLPPPRPTQPPAGAPALGGDGVWDRLAECESSNTNDLNAPYYGYWQIDAGTWHGLGEPGLPNEQSRAYQLAAAKRLQAARGWTPWPACSASLGLK